MTRRGVKPPASKSGSSVDWGAKLQAAVGAHQRGDSAAAESGYLEVLRLNPDSHDALHLLGLIALQRGDPRRATDLTARAIELAPNVAAYYATRGTALKNSNRPVDALESYDRAIALKPDYAEAYSNRGNAFWQLKRLNEALDSYDRAIALKPDYAEAYSNRGAVLRDLKRPEEAIASCDRAIELKPDHAVAHSNRGNALKDLKRLEEALGSYDRAIALKPDVAEPFSNRANTLRRLGRLVEALESYDRAIVLRPNFAQAHFNRANLLVDLGRPREALSSYEQAIALKPDHAQAHLNRGNTLKALDQPEVALGSYDRAIALKPDYAEAYSSRGNALKDLNRVEEALESYDRAIALKPDYAEAYSNRGNALRELNRLDEAIACYEQAIARKPDYAAIHWNEGVCRLLMGDFELGWKKYEYRWQSVELEKSKRDFRQPLWSGNEPLEGRTILLHAEQGLGDTIQFCRYATRVAERGATVVLEVQPSLKSLLGSVAGVHQIVGIGEKLPAFDCHCPLLSLPLAFNTGLENIPADVPYVLSDHQKTALWQSRLGRKTAPRIGLTWSGSTKHKKDHNRSIPLARLLEAMPAGMHLYSLQKDVRHADRAVLDGRVDVARFDDDLKDFSDTAALISQLDLVISVDTSVAHLAGALGKPVWVLLPVSPDWRWLLNRDDSPWYPSARLFRQSALGDWTGALTRLAQELHALAPAGRPRSAVDVDAKLSQAVTAHQQGRSAEAEAGYLEVLRLDPKNRDALHLLGLIELRRNNPQRAVALIGQAIELAPGTAAYYSSHGTALRSLKRLEEALASYDRAIALKPDYAEACSNRGNVLVELKRQEEALASYDRAVALRPEYAEAYANRGSALRDLGRPKEALASCDRAIALDSGNAQAYSNRGNALKDLNRLEEALASYDRAIAIRPNFAEAYANRASTLQSLNRLQEALASCERAAALKPDHALAHWNESVCRLLMGDFELGWSKYEYRWSAELEKVKRDFPQPLWLGKESLEGKTILLHAEQGLGDTIQFCRYARRVAERGATVVLQVQRALKSLVSTAAGAHQILANGEGLPAFDYHCPLMSLPLAFSTRLESIPADTPYLSSDPQKAAIWRARLGERTAFRVGLVWSGSTKHKKDHNRSIPLAMLIAAMPTGVQPYSLQKDVREADQVVLDGRSDIVHFGEELKDFSDTAALISQLDLVISVDTSVAHLAGALGKPVWILLPFSPDWRWLLGRDDSPWYPSARLFRQPAMGDWASTLTGITHALQAFAAVRTPSQRA